MITLNGRFAQYSIEDPALPTEGARVYVYDAKNGEVEFQADANNPDIPDQRVMVDRGTEINETSLAKSRDELTIYWLNGGEARSAPLD